MFQLTPPLSIKASVKNTLNTGHEGCGGLEPVINEERGSCCWEPSRIAHAPLHAFVTNIVIRKEIKIAPNTICR